MKDILIVGEAYGEHEEKVNVPFVGPAGWELDGWLKAVGLDRRKDCYITNVVNKRPPHNDFDAFTDREVQEGVSALWTLIDAMDPDTILALGNVPLYHLTDERGITKWRGSMLTVGGRKVMPTYHPAGVLRQYEWRPIALHDIRKALKFRGRPWPKREENFLIDPTVGELEAWLPDEDCAVDIETNPKAGHITCLGLAKSETEAICVPFYAGWDFILSREKRRLLAEWLREHGAIGQNFLYDNQYIHNEFGFTVRVADDTLLQHHVLYPKMEKSLGYLSSLYLEPHIYWKDEGRNATDSLTLWTYNCRDCVATYSLSSIFRTMLSEAGLSEVYEFQLRLADAALRTMLRGVRFDRKRALDLQADLDAARQSRIDLFETFRKAEPDTIGPRGGVKKNSPWWTSNKKLQAVLYKEWGLPEKRSRATGSATTNSEALLSLVDKAKEDWQKEIIKALSEYRSLSRFSDFLKSEVDPDGRMRCSFNPAGTSTFRFSSSENAFGRGTNLQNISKGNEDD